MRPLVEWPVQGAFQQCAQQRRAQKGQRQADQKRHALALHQQHRDVAPQHGKRTMGQVDEIHQAHGDRQADRQDEEQHAIGNAVKQDGQHGRVFVG